MRIPHVHDGGIIESFGRKGERRRRRFSEEVGQGSQGLLPRRIGGRKNKRSWWLRVRLSARPWARGRHSPHADSGRDPVAHSGRGRENPIRECLIRLSPLRIRTRGGIRRALSSQSLAGENTMTATDTRQYMLNRRAQWIIALLGVINVSGFLVYAIEVIFSPIRMIVFGTGAI